MSRTTLLIALIIGLCFLPGCDSESGSGADAEASQKPSFLVSEGRVGPVVAQVFLDREELRFGDRVRLRLTAQVEGGAILQDPGFGDRLGHLRVRDRIDPSLDDKEQARSQTWMFEVEPERAGLNIGKIPDIPFQVAEALSSSSGEAEAHKPEQTSETRFVKVPSFKLEVAGLSEDARPDLSVAKAA